MRTGVCTCQPGVEGGKCDRCMPGHWNLGPNGCQGKCSIWACFKSGCGGLVTEHPSNMLVYLRDRSALIIVCGATQRYQL